jgi:predicted ATPase
MPGGDNTPTKTFEYEVSLLGNFRSPAIVIESESLSLVMEKRREPIFEYKPGAGNWTMNGKTTTLNLAPNDRSVLEFIGFPEFEGTAFKNLLASWRFYELVSALMRTENRPTPEKFLSENGEKFSSWLMTLQTHPEAFAKFKRVACDALPSLSEVLIQPTQTASVTVSSRESNLRRPISIQRMSNGELAFLGLISLVFAPQELAAPLYCIEEPENHLHPYMLETLVEVLRQRQDELGLNAGQIIASTHSPQLVDKIGIEDLIITEKLQGQTRFSHPADDEELRTLVARKDLGLGDLWYTGALSRE